MTSHAGRLYALAAVLVVFFLAWATIAAHPWGATAAADPRLKALAVREAQLRQQGKLVQAVVTQRWAAYRARLQARRAEIAVAKARATQLAAAAASESSVPAAASSSSVRVVNLPPLTITRTS